MTDPWWQTAFGEDYLTIYAHRDDAAAKDEIGGLLPRLRRAPGPVLDACGGAGRHHQALHDAGLSVVGFDWSMPLLRQAAQRPSIAGRLARGDVRSPPFSRGFGAVLLLFTAFGYFDELSNQRTLAGLAELVALGGWLVLDLPEATRVRAGLVPRSERTLPDGTLVHERRWLDGDHVCKTITIDRDGQPQRQHQERVRLYTDAEIASLAMTAGLDPVDTWNSLRGGDRDDGRRVWWLRRP